MSKRQAAGVVPRGIQQRAARRTKWIDLAF